MYMCKKCGLLAALILLLIGIGFLLKDWEVWNFWSLSWWTVLFLFMGLVKLCKHGCKECATLEKKKK